MHKWVMQRQLLNLQGYIWKYSGDQLSGGGALSSPIGHIKALQFHGFTRVFFYQFYKYKDSFSLVSRHSDTQTPEQ